MRDAKTKIIIGEARRSLAELPPGIAQCCVTSPPYFGLRDYGHDDQVGLEDTPEAYIEELVSVFRELRRVLRPDGTLWVNIGDSMSSGNRATYGVNNAHCKQATQSAVKDAKRPPMPDGIKPKDMIGIPWMLAFAMRADGWYLRQECIWNKPNPMPGSARDRCTTSHESIFLFAKSERYFFDNVAIAEKASGRSGGASFGKQGDPEAAKAAGAQSRTYDRPEYPTRFPRSVWTIVTQPYKGAHFATFPEELPRRCIKAGTSSAGRCSVCGTPYARATPTAFLSTCSCASLVQDAEPCLVIDPFAGSGTTLAVAAELGCDSIGIELNPEFAALAKERTGKSARPSTYRSDEEKTSPLFQGGDL